MIRALRIVLWLPVAALFLALAVSFDRESRDRAADKALADSIGVHQARAQIAIRQAVAAGRRADSIADLRRADSAALAKARSADDAFRRRLRRVATAASPDSAPTAGGSLVTLVLVRDGAGQAADTLAVPAVVDSALTAAWDRGDRLEVEVSRLGAQLVATEESRDNWRAAAAARGHELSLERERRVIAERAASGASRRGVVKGAVGAVAVIGTLALVFGGR